MESDDSGNFCYRHPGRQSYILCQRCARTVCPACATQASVGVHCPECVKAGRARAPRQRPIGTRVVRAFRQSSSVPVVTYSIMAICIVVYGLQFLLGDALTFELLYYPPVTAERPWTLLTSVFAHVNVIHLLFNMFSLFMIGPALELGFGRLRFLALYLLSGFGGGIAVLYISGDVPVLGASGAIFGLLGALVIAIRRLGGNVTQLLIVLVLNLSIGFFMPLISWEAHVGGLIVGVLTGLIFVRTRGPRNRNLQLVLLGGLGALLLAMTAIATLYR